MRVNGGVMGLKCKLSGVEANMRRGGYVGCVGSMRMQWAGRVQNRNVKKYQKRTFKPFSRID
jgi:hypothetical protein